jgi:hypothetical protein
MFTIENLEPVVDAEGPFNTSVSVLTGAVSGLKKTGRSEQVYSILGCVLPFGAGRSVALPRLLTV